MMLFIVLLKCLLPLKCLFTIDMSSLVSVQILWQFLKIVLFSYFWVMKILYKFWIQVIYFLLISGRDCIELILLLFFKYLVEFINEDIWAWSFGGFSGEFSSMNSISLADIWLFRLSTSWLNFISVCLPRFGPFHLSF